MLLQPVYLLNVEFLTALWTPTRLRSMSRSKGFVPTSQSAMPSNNRRLLTNLALSVLLIASIWGFSSELDRHYAIAHWLVWRYIGYWLAAITWALSCLAFGLRTVRALRVARHGDDDNLVLAFPLGVFAFHLAVFILGIGHILHWSTFFLLPLAFLLVGVHDLRECLQLWWNRRTRFSHSLLICWLFGACGVALLYFQVLSPETFSHDARWYHLPIAQQYATDGAVKPWPEGWWLAAYPHLSSYLYVWAFLLPKSLIFDRFELCAHLELVVFLATIASIPSLVRKLIPDASARGTWVTIFLFPGIFLYDSNLNVGADHIAALWAIPMMLTVLRLWNRWQRNDCLLFAIFVSGAALTKYSALCIIVPSVLALLLRALYLTFEFKSVSPAQRFRPLLMVGVIGLLGLLLTTPHWLKNWIWYGDPLYPVLNKWLRVHPWNSDSPAQFQLFCNQLGGAGADSSTLGGALRAIYSFSFEASDWPVLHGNVPVFGSLFTLTALCLPLLSAPRRLWGLCVSAMLSVGVWYWVSPRARFLQTALPWMAVCVAATLLLLWNRRHVLVRGLVLALVGLQICWGSDVPFFPTHNMIQESPFRLVTSFLASGFLRTPNRFRFYGDTGAAGELLPNGSVLLLHNVYQANLGVHFVNDLWQGGINYGELASPDAIYQRLRTYGVSDLVWYTKKGLDWTSLAHDMAFANFALNYVIGQRPVGQLTLGHMPRQAPSTTFNDRVAMLTCGQPFRSGWYNLQLLGSGPQSSGTAHPYATVTSPAAAVESAGFLVVEPSCGIRLPPELADRFHEPYDRGQTKFYVRRLGR
jgi:hypothetical protein